MAIVFELVANCGGDEIAAQEFAENIAKRLKDVHIGNHRISMHQPHSYKIRDKNTQAILVSIIPKQVGYRVGLDQEDYRIPLTSSELTELGNVLYDFIREIPSYRVALVGWDVDWTVCYEELKSERSEELDDGDIDGLIVANDLLFDLPGKEHFVPFDAEHSWIPYEGTKAIE